MLEFTLASSNSHKAQEFSELFSSEILVIKAASIKVEVIEDGTSFQENAYKKAFAYNKKLKKPTMADDSGLVIPARADILGIHSARYAPEFSDYKDKNNKLLEDIKDLSDDDRKAYFACYLCFYLSENEVYFFEGRVHGKIAKQPSGLGGFGYDPIFLPDGQGGKTLSELNEWKMKNSHRAKACYAAQNFFQGLRRN